ncbi:4-phosphoerythronate dehydrogenase PdxB [Parendozoicomonas haliclonae]|uniref:Erythronate-4-phosphate dehydrogenase n=1 Tax=Parendozoicomonas haliclonae TaxID=1960125 RepID=A0A1X7AIE0_9GAMM|nr:4-phosphoerythronate dehydrogenase PdxB [Parendozoicomonas haliclonae]SMA43484.1 Erythronate-4-phosphate dehydrogenase [Parendozoicomonas haliclonae]
MPKQSSGAELTIVADENIPLLNEFFAGFGSIRKLPGRSMTPADVADADVLLVRSVTEVNEHLLAGSSVKFVATATSGTDHIDTQWLEDNQIGFASAAGCNADAVVDYVFTALNALSDGQGLNIEGKVFGIVGYGQVGSRLYTRLQQLDIKCLVCDPFKETPDQVSIDELVEGADIISLHTPLTQSGEEPTWHLLDGERLSRLKEGSVLINAGRGEVVDNVALIRRLQSDSPITAVLDVWENEPALSTELLELVALGTPHIAGYSVDGKVRGTEMIYQAMCQWLNTPADISLDTIAPVPALQTLSAAGENIAEITAASIRLLYDIRRDDHCLRALAKTAGDDTSALVKGFDQLRRHYPKRREFNTLTVQVPETANALERELAGIGFSIESGK